MAGLTLACGPLLEIGGNVALFWAMGSSGDSRQGIAARHAWRAGAFYPARPSPLDQVLRAPPRPETQPRIVQMRGFVSAWQNTGSGAAGSSSYFGNHYHRLRSAVRFASYRDDGG